MRDFTTEEFRTEDCGSPRHSRWCYGGGGGGFMDFLAPAAAIVGSAFLGPEVGVGLETLGMTTGAETLGGALAGAGLGAASSAATGKDPLTGALMGGAGGALAPNLGDIFSGVTGALGLGGEAAAGEAMAAPASFGAGWDAPLTPAIGSNIAPGGMSAAGLGSSGGLNLGDAFTTQFGPSLAGTAGPVTMEPIAAPSGATQTADVAASPVGPQAAPNQSDMSWLGPQGAPPQQAPGMQYAGQGPTFAGNQAALEAATKGAGSAAAKPFDYAGSWLGSSGVPQNMITEAIAKNPLQAAGIGLSGGMMLKNLMGDQTVPGQGQLTDAQKRLSEQSQQMMGYLNNGQLPAGAQASLDRMVKNAQAAVRSQFASHGMSGSTAEQDAMQQIQTNALIAQNQMATQLFGQGVQLAGMDMNAINNIITQNTAAAKEMGQSLSNFAAALAGGGPQVQLRLGA